jgi:hypothetical protein
LEFGVSIFVPWTARFAVACYLVRLAVDIAWTESPPRWRWSRAIWTVGCIIFLAHVAAAFHFVHGWSHAAAFEHTRRQTQALTGWDSGAGLYLNYLFTAWWVLDVLAWWRWVDWPQRRVPYWMMQAYFAFLMFNATVVFGPRGWMVVGGVVGVGLVVLWARRRREVCG